MYYRGATLEKKMFTPCLKIDVGYMDMCEKILNKKNCLRNA